MAVRVSETPRFNFCVQIRLPSCFKFRIPTFVMKFQSFSSNLDIKNFKFYGFLKFEITNPVIGYCQSTLKGCISYFQYMIFSELSKIQSTGGALR